METKMLDDLSTALEQVMKTLRGGTRTKKRMSLDELVSYALVQIGKAAEDEPAVANRRLAALKRSVDDVIGQVAKMVAENTESESIKVDVETAFAPTKADGDKPMDGLTTAADQSSTETPLATSGSAAEKLAQVGKALKKMKAELGKPDRKARTAAKKSDEDRNADPGDEDEGGDEPGDVDPDVWPVDLNTSDFRKGVEKAGDEPLWGNDPEGLTSSNTG